MLNIGNEEIELNFKPTATTQANLESSNEESSKMTKSSSSNEINFENHKSLTPPSQDNLQLTTTQFKQIDLNDQITTEDAEVASRSESSQIDNSHLSSSPNILSSDKSDDCLNQNEILKNSIKLFRSEFRRMGFNEKYWRYTSFNKNFTLCSTYPPYFIVPSQFLDEDLTQVAKFRHINRLPSVVYRHRNGALIVRSSQPSVGLLNRRSTEDEKLLQLILANCIQDQCALSAASKSTSSQLNSLEERKCLHDHQTSNCDFCSTTQKSDLLQSSCTRVPENYSSSDHLEAKDAVINSKDCYQMQTSNNSKFFSLSDKIFENIMSYTSYTDHALSQSLDQQNTSLVDEKSSCTDEMKKLLILDARSFTVAFLNRALGGGSECSEYYPNCEVDFLYLANIHAVRTAFFSLKTLIRSNTDTNQTHYAPNNNYFTNWSKSNSNYWLYYISNLIESALKVVKAIDQEARPVLIHCSDGWDRTAQIASLAELMLDPFYRTIEGFKVLVQREWLDFGHKFADRCGLCPVSKNVNERSPIFVQWLDCVHQIVRQCPDYFDFNCSYLEELALHTYSPLFGTFLCNSYLERFINQIHGETTSVWSYLEKSRDKFVNENYVETTKVLEPSCSVSDMVLWRDLYEKLINDEFESRFDFKNPNQLNSNPIMRNQQLIDAHNLRNKKLFRTHSFTFSTKTSTKPVSVGHKLRKVKSDSDLSQRQSKKIVFASNVSKSDDKQSTMLSSRHNQPIKALEQYRNLNFQHSDRRLDPQPNGIEALNNMYSSNDNELFEHSCKNNIYQTTQINGNLNGTSGNDTRTCKFFESQTNRNFLNCDSELQYQVPLKVIARIAQTANPDSSLVMSVLTYVNTLHTFSVK